MKIIFAGSPEYAVLPLEKLHEEYGVAAALTQPDKPTGRKKILTPTAVKKRAEELGIPVFDFKKVGEHAAEIKSLGADIMITCAYGQILTREILDIFPGGVWNLHASLLPKFRGASPVQSAILAGETHTGVTVMRTELAVDAGDILLVKRCGIGDMNYGELRDVLSALSADAAVEAVRILNDGQPQLLLQDDAKATYCKKISKSDGKIDFGNSPADICRLIRAMNPDPVAYCNFGGNILNILRAEPLKDCAGEKGTVICADKRGIAVCCNGGGILIKEIIPSGGRRMSAADFVNGRKIKAGDVLD